MKNIALLFIIASFVFSCQQKHKPNISRETKDSFSFVFMTDIHITPEKNATKGLLQAIDTINFLAPDFVITGVITLWMHLGNRMGKATACIICMKKQ